MSDLVKHIIMAHVNLLCDSLQSTILDLIKIHHYFTPYGVVHTPYGAYTQDFSRKKYLKKLWCNLISLVGGN